MRCAGVAASHTDVARVVGIRSQLRRVLVARGCWALTGRLAFSQLGAAVHALQAALQAEGWCDQGAGVGAAPLVHGVCAGIHGRCRLHCPLCDLHACLIASKALRCPCLLVVQVRQWVREDSSLKHLAGQVIAALDATVEDAE